MIGIYSNLHLRMRFQSALDFKWVDVCTTSNDQRLGAPQQCQKSLILRMHKKQQIMSSDLLNILKSIMLLMQVY